MAASPRSASLTESARHLRGRPAGGARVGFRQQLPALRPALVQRCAWAVAGSPQLVACGYGGGGARAHQAFMTAEQAMLSGGVPHARMKRSAVAAS